MQNTMPVRQSPAHSLRTSGIRQGREDHGESKQARRRHEFAELKHAPSGQRFSRVVAFDTLRLPNGFHSAIRGPSLAKLARFARLDHPDRWGWSVGHSLDLK